MKIKLTQSVRVLMPAGTEVDLEDSQAALLVSIGHATQIEDKPVKKPAPKITKKRLISWRTRIS